MTFQGLVLKHHKMMSYKDRKNLNLFGDTNSINNLVKYPKIPAVIANTFKEYGSAESLINHIFFYLVEQYQSFDLDTFLGQKWIDIDPEIIARELRLATSYLSKKTLNCNPPYLSRHAYDLAFRGKRNLSLDVSKWTDEQRAIYDDLSRSVEPFYDTVLTDALYRMWQQKIEINGPVNKSIASMWQKTYSKTGFSMLEQLSLTQQKVHGGTKITSIKVLLSDELINQIHCFFILKDRN